MVVDPAYRANQFNLPAYIASAPPIVTERVLPPPQTFFPPNTGVVQVTAPIVVKAGEVFDGQGQLFINPNGTQEENLPPVFILEPGATLQNVQIVGGDGVHTLGDATLNNVWWPDVGEDALTIEGAGIVTVNGGGAYLAEDKIFQINAPGSTLSINGFDADNFSKAVRTDGGMDFPVTINISNSSFRNAQEAIVRTDCLGANINFLNVLSSPLDVPWEVVAPPTALMTGVVRSTYFPPEPEPVPIP